MEKRKNDLVKIMVENTGSHLNIQNFIDEYDETVAGLLFAHDICVHYSDLGELDERHQGAINMLWDVAQAFLKAGYLQEHPDSN